MNDSSSSVKVLAIASGKGGTGKSIIVASLGYLLAHCGFKTLLIDMDLFTNGLTFYVLRSFPRKPKISTTSIFLGEQKFVDLSPILIPNEFCNDKLYIFPAIPIKEDSSKFIIDEKFNNFSSFINQVQQIIQVALNDGFEYIILDTRGGGDLTSIGSILAAEGFMIVTEADKISWDIGQRLLNNINDTVELDTLGEEIDVSRLGFIINKNVLPAESIISFLTQAWECPSLATIPLDKNAVRCFQQNIIPVAENITIPFCVALLPLIRKVFVSEGWDKDNKFYLNYLEKKIAEAEIIERKKLKHEANISIIRNITKVYGIFLSTFLLVFLAYNLIISNKTNSIELALLVFITATMIIMITIFDKEFFEIVKAIILKMYQK
ncbi:MAG: ParA family protein [Crocosphaera sp.]|nr:ParA family protein [Crocosphaera sp.]